MAESAAATAAGERPLVDKENVRNHIAAGFLFFLIAIFAGLFYALQLDGIYPFKGVELASPGRVRMLHTNAVAYGFLFNLFIAALNWIVPRLTGKPVFNALLSKAIFWAWQLIVLATAVGIIGGQAQAIEWGETPTWIDPVVLVGGALLILNTGTPIFQVRERKLYVTLWYFSAMMVWLPLVYAMGNFIPQYFIAGAGGAAITGLYIHDLVGLTVTPLGWGMMYYFVPVITKKPIWSHTLSLVGFWGLAFFYPLQGVHHFLFSPIPMYAQYGAVVSTIAIEIVVFTVIVNFFMTLRGKGDMLRSSLPVRWFYAGMVCYFITCFQCAFHVTLTFQRIIHFTDWVPGHAHLVMFGVFGFWCIGMTVYLWPKLVNRPWYSNALNSWNFWLTTIGVFLMFLDLTAAGVVQGYMWLNLSTWSRMLEASAPFWHVRSIAGLAIITGQLLQVYNMWMTARSTAPAGEARESDDTETAAATA
ncbi:MAG: cbb3-type cytochrome c oxidase subunit I [Myxococcales bacterium]|nr:cbb3-type cytochrome c oxidase subunit I [Myxococcales bacterium]MCA9628559.1 cbb3-type cytochrome c oxidase subunit I [Myxococcales bacterium]